MSGFFQELQRRKVYRVAAAYIIAAGFIIQIGSAVIPAWELPNWTLRLVIVLLLVGFPVALILAWAYDVTPQGIQATPRVHGRHRRRNIILLVAAGAIISTAAGFFLLPRASAHKIDKSIAVLPFQNLSAERENAYFAEGIQNEILTKLATVRDLCHFANLDGEVSEQAGQLKDSRARARRFRYPRGDGTESWRQSSGECAVDRCPGRYASLGEQL
jgi:hypothetical protein